MPINTQKNIGLYANILYIDFKHKNSLDVRCPGYFCIYEKNNNNELMNKKILIMIFKLWTHFLVSIHVFYSFLD